MLYFYLPTHMNGFEGDLSMNDDIATSNNKDSEIYQLINMLSTSEDWQVRNKASANLINYGQKAVQPLLSAIETKSLGNYGGFGLAMETLGDIGDERAVEQLIKLLEFISPHIRQKAAEALGKIGDPRAIEPLIESFKFDSDDEEDFSAWQFASEALGNFGKTALPYLERALTKADKQVRRFIIESLWFIKEPRTVNLLINALNDVDYVVRASAAEGLGYLNDKKAIKPLLDVFKTDKSLYVKLKSADSLGNLKSLEAVPTFMTTLSNKMIDRHSEPNRISWQEVRYSIVNALGKIKDPDSFEPLILALADEDILMRWYSAKALGNIGNKQALAALEEVQRNDKSKISNDNDVAKVAGEAIRKIMSTDSLN